jgi:hypothetical protein
MPLASFVCLNALSACKGAAGAVSAILAAITSGNNALGQAAAYEFDRQRYPRFRKTAREWGTLLPSLKQ